MRLSVLLFAVLAPVAAQAEAFQRPTPEVQTAQAEASYLAASVLLLLVLVAVQWLVSRR